MRIAIIGDIHGCWDKNDNAFFEEADIDLVLFTGDLATYTGSETFRIAKLIAQLRKPAALIPGNHDCVTLAALAGEVFRAGWVSSLQAGIIAKRYEKLRQILANRLLGYSAQEFGPFTIVGARPFSMDGTRLSFAGPLRTIFGIHSLKESATRIGALISQAPQPVIVLAHNGPRGLGAERHDPFGVDFRKEGGDNGDADLAEALHAHGNKVALVVAGHMHHKVRGSRQPRTFAADYQGIPVVNGARVPRHTGGHGYYLEIETDGKSFSPPRERWYDRSGSRAVEPDARL